MGYVLTNELRLSIELPMLKQKSALIHMSWRMIQNFGCSNSDLKIDLRLTEVDAFSSIQEIC
jgi:hypothetical protein